MYFLVCCKPKATAAYDLPHTHNMRHVCPFAHAASQCGWKDVKKESKTNLRDFVVTKNTQNLFKLIYINVHFLTFICPCIAGASLKYNQQDATFSRSIYFYKLLYMFQAVPPPIIRSTKLYIQRQVLSNQYCYRSRQQYWFDNT